MKIKTSNGLIDRIEPTYYVSEIWGGGKNGEGEGIFKNEIAIKTFMDLVDKRYQVIVSSLDKGRFTLSLASLQDWIKGFLHGLKCFKTNWDEVYEVIPQAIEVEQALNALAVVDKQSLNYILTDEMLKGISTQIKRIFNQTCCLFGVEVTDEVPKGDRCEDYLNFSTHDFSQIEVFLDGPNSSMRIETIDGFFTALLSFPDHVGMPSLFDKAWCGQEVLTQEMLKSSEELFIKYYHAVSSWLELEFRSPSLPLSLRDGRGLTSGPDWAKGFLKGIDLIQGLEELNEAPHVIQMLKCVEGLANASIEDALACNKKFIKRAVNSIFITKQHQMLADYEKLRALLTEDQDNTVGRETEEIDNFVLPNNPRNKPCPCGSGSKYKNCCLRAKHA